MLIKCPECGKDVSDKALKCPGCGFPVRDCIICEECGTRNDKKSKSCSYCGFPFVEDEKCRFCNDGTLDLNGYCNKCGMDNKNHNRFNIKKEIPEIPAPKKENKNETNTNDSGFKRNKWVFIFLILFALIALINSCSQNSENDNEVPKEEVSIEKEEFDNSEETIDYDDKKRKENIEKLTSEKTIEKEKLQDYKNIELDQKYKQNFINACTSCGINIEKVNSLSKIENWSNGERYTFYYNNLTHSVYFLDSGEVNSINYNGNNDIKLYEYGYEPLNINDFEIDINTYSTLQVAAENVVKKDLKFPKTADFNWFTTGFCTRYYDYYIIGCEFTAENAFGVDEKHNFRIHSTINDNTSDFIYYELDGNIISGKPNIPEIKKVPITNLIQSNDGTIKIVEGIPGEYGKEDNFDGEKNIRYYIPSGKYIATCDTQGSVMYIETIELHKEDGFDTATTIERISFQNNEESFNIEIRDGECVSLTLNSIVNLTKISE